MVCPSRRARLMLDISRAFFMPDNRQGMDSPRLTYIDSLRLPVRIHLRSFGIVSWVISNGSAAVFLSALLITYDTLMKAIQLKAPASLGIAMIAKSVAKTVSNNAMGLAVTFGTASFIGSLLDAIPFASISALLMVGSLYSLNAKKGGSEC